MRDVAMGIETRQGRSGPVASHLRLLARTWGGIQDVEVSSTHSLSARWQVPDDVTFEGVAEALRAFDGDIVSVNWMPTDRPVGGRRRRAGHG
jgi:hypothetical protein